MAHIVSDIHIKRLFNRINRFKISVIGEPEDICAEVGFVTGTLFDHEGPLEDFKTLTEHLPYEDDNADFLIAHLESKPEHGRLKRMRMAIVDVNHLSPNFRREDATKLLWQHAIERLRWLGCDYICLYGLDFAHSQFGVSTEESCGFSPYASVGLKEIGMNHRREPWFFAELSDIHVFDIDEIPMDSWWEAKFDVLGKGHRWLYDTEEGVWKAWVRDDIFFLKNEEKDIFLSLKRKDLLNYNSYHTDALRFSLEKNGVKVVEPYKSNPLGFVAFKEEEHEWILKCVIKEALRLTWG